MKEKFDNYKKNKRELQILEKSLDKLNAQLLDVPEVSVKVQKSGDDFPYIEGHMTVIASEPKEATKIKDKIREKEKKVEQLAKDIKAVEDFIENMPEGIEKEIFEMWYLDEMNQNDIAKVIGYSQGRVSQILNGYIKD